MRFVGETLRLITIQRVLIRYGLDDVLLRNPLAWPLRMAFKLAPDRILSRKTRALPRAVRVHRALEDLGPIFVKLGQTLSTRRDLLPDDIADELAKLQDQVTPFDSQQAKALIEEALGQSVEEAFASFEAEPLASASIAQVHAATLKNGREVIVKVLRPDMEKNIRRDIGLMYHVARLAEKYWPDGRRLRPVEVVAEFEKTIFDELDLVREGANAVQLRRNFQDSELLYVPEIFWDYTRQNVLVMERIYGVQVSDMEGLKAANTNMLTLAERGVEVFFTQVFRDNFFHADMHPGNIFIDVSDPQSPRYIAVDFGIVGSLTEGDRRYLAENLVAFFHRDYAKVARLHVETGWVPANTRVEDFEAAIRTVCEPIFEKPLAEISFGLVLIRLFQTARRFDMQVQPQLVLLEKTLLHIEGLGRVLYPELDLWKTAKPQIERWLSEQVGHRAMAKRLRDEAPGWGEVLPELPRLVHGVLKQQQEAGGLQRRQMQQLLDNTSGAQNSRSTLLALGSAVAVLVSVLMAGFSQLAGEPAPGSALLIGGGGVAIWLSLVLRAK
ncbi:MAG: ubiquinone biosynthesis regulatory protein kinase UbiB [Granulosicoccaceae bacterium]